MSRPSNKEPKRKQIALGLLKVMTDKGFDAASIGDIADSAGLTKGLIHYYFKSKEEILIVALKTMVDDYDERIENKVISSGDSPLRHLDAFIDFHLALGKDAQPEILSTWIVITGEALRKDEVREEYHRALDITREWVEAIIKNCIEDGCATCDDVDAASTAIVASIQGYFVLAATYPNFIPSGSAANAVKQMARGLLTPTGGAA